MKILTDYKIQLVNRINFGKQIFTINDDLTACLNEFYTEGKASDLLSFINEAIDTNGLEIQFPTPSLYLIIIKSPNVNVYADIGSWESNNNIISDYTLPITHFKVIVETWRDYLMQ
ncbi:hypothetical protein FLJC2902T_12770 [Flavobacterium limnosediminis JC2902]|uniref:Uncharacterized protein n=1 Tax=Flavobacterium limnosediminis JC2902 TaxID=1341181 RepID=V6SPZ9_9FLAO|nr:hypothetical protein [Flavobacterium limnosediminis]ESU28686.1 hypothetical protein FLJC2902T_12770 [Flavobacterium limnosediminis JC2902]